MIEGGERSTRTEVVTVGSGDENEGTETPGDGVAEALRIRVYVQTGRRVPV